MVRNQIKTHTEGSNVVMTGEVPLTLANDLQALDELALKKLQLSPKDELEAISFGNDLHKYKRDQVVELAMKTKNAGIQYILCGNDYSSMLITTYNKTLHKEVVLLIVENLSLLDISVMNKSEQANYCDTLFLLLRSPAVVVDVKLFKRVFNMTEEMSDLFLSTASTRHVVLCSALQENSMPQVGNNAMGVDTLLFILKYFHKNNPSSSTNEISTTILTSRKEEIEAWIKETMPDCAGLPLTWVFEVLDLYI
jgi:hypothetical protein